MTSGCQVQTVDEAVTAAKCLLTKGCKNHVLITLGAQGAVLLSKGAEDKPVHVKAPSVSSIDTTVMKHKIFFYNDDLLRYPSLP